MMTTNSRLNCADFLWVMVMSAAIIGLAAATIYAIGIFMGLWIGKGGDNKKPKLDRYGRDISLVNQARAKAKCKPPKLPPSPPKRPTPPGKE